MLITHDLGVVAEVCDEVAVMYAGEIVERAPVDALFDAPEHPYTVGLLGSIPRLDARAETLAAIDGVVPDMTSPPVGCRFAPRCPFVIEACTTTPPPVIELGGGRWSRCLRAPLERLVAQAAQRQPVMSKSGNAACGPRTRIARGARVAEAVRCEPQPFADRTAA